ncbi:MAG: SusD/RagB family nutrient-binding outer membrane lipoprotein [Bacteroidales bacterium]|nr:SusD/RagB family nutrient-binding outer membrane lipoprotein [Bacteroidales bacterium]
MKKIFINIAIIILIFNVSCVKDLTDLNVDPNNQNTVDPHLLFKFSVKRGMGNFYNASHFEYNGLHQWMMYFATRGGIEPGNEYPQPSTSDAFWSENYVDAMNNAQLIIQMAEENPELVNMASVATIWKVYLMHRVTDLWGDAPYSQALNGYPNLNFTPEYDNQQEIYTLMLLQLEKAVESFDDEKEFFTVESDLIYEGNIDTWKRFGNSLRLRLATHINQVDPVLSSEIITSLQESDLIESNDQIATFQFNSVFNKPLYEAGSIQYKQGSNYINPSKFLVDLIIEKEDPRKHILFEKSDLSATFPFLDEYRGIPNLLAYNSEIWDQYNLDAQLIDPQGEYGDVSRMGKWFLNNDRPFALMTYGEVCFLKAEAAINGIWPGNAMDYFKSGIRAHMEYINLHLTEQQAISEIQINNFLNSFNELTLEEIITQKYILFAYENVIEAYAEYRRTGFPVLTDYYGDPINDEIFPKRIKYPFSEFTLNRTNYEKAVDHQGPDDKFTHIWWDIE